MTINHHSFESLTIAAIAHATPPLFKSSEEIEENLDEVYHALRFSKGRLEFLSGVKERGFWPLDTYPSYIATSAALNLFNQYNLGPKDIDLLIYAGVSKDCIEPATASFVHCNLGLKDSCAFFDVSNACLGMLDALSLAGYLLSDKIKRILIVSGEHAAPLYSGTMSHLKQRHKENELTRHDFRPLLANLTLGSAGVAMLLTNQKSSGLKIKKMIRLTDSKSADLCRGSHIQNNLMMNTDSETLMKKGLELALGLWQQGRTFLFEEKQPDMVFTHQVGSVHHRELLSRLELSPIFSPTTFKNWGNTGSAALPLTLSIHLFQSKEIVKVDQVALLGIGSGLSAMMLSGEYCV